MKRRQFLKTSAAAIGVPYFVPSTVFGANAPSNRINVGFIGLGNQSTIDLPSFLRNDDVQVVAVCDVNTASHGYRDADQFLGRKPGLEKVNAHYAKKTGNASYKGCSEHVDFREVISNKDIDAVVIVVPDHWHAIMAIEAAKAGKDIYCEKPMTLTVDEGKRMVKAVRDNQRILQVGSQYRSSPAARKACELVRNGRIGKLERIHTYLPGNNATDPVGWKPMPIPEGFNYDMWLGPAPDAPYHVDRCLYRFRFILEYSGGQITNTGAHANDVAQWGHGTDLTGPTEFEDAGSEWYPAGSLFNVATKTSFKARYADGVELLCHKNDPGFGVRFEGTEGWILFDSKGVHASKDSILTSVIGPNEVHLAKSIPSREENSPKNYLADHVRNFLDCVKSRQDPVEPVEVGHRTASLCHLGNIAMRLKRKIYWDPTKEEIVGDPEAAAMLSRPTRGTWTVAST